MLTLVTGATGFVGRRLIASLEKPVVVLSRDAERARRALGAGVEAYRWEPEAEPAPAEAFRGVEAVFHLAGDSVAAGRWTRAKKQRIRNSRVLGTRNLVTSLKSLRERPRVLVSASAIGFYGDRGDELLDETSAPGNDFLAQTCQEWEAEARHAEPLGIRVVTPRIGVVLGEDGGALAKMLTPFKLGLGGRLGHGRQWMSWIHLDDLAALLLDAAGKNELSGAINAVSPEPVENREFTRVLASVLHRPAIFPAPAPALRLALGEMAGALLLVSQRVVPRVAEKAGFRFRYPALAGALQAAVGGHNDRAAGADISAPRTGAA